MPQVIIIDEIGTELEAAAARTIAERGVQLVATAHGNTLENLIMNPTLSDLVGGIQTVTLGDEEARRRGTQKSILERKAPPTFEVVVEIQDRDKVAVHPHVAVTVDALLRGRPVTPEVRWLDKSGQVKRSKGTFAAGPVSPPSPEPARLPYTRPAGGRLYPFGVNRHRLEEAIQETGAPVSLASDLAEATLLITTRNLYRRRPPSLRDAEGKGVPIYVLRSNTLPQMRQFLRTFSEPQADDGSEEQAIREAEDSISRILGGEGVVELSPQPSPVRRLQHQLAESYGLDSRSQGKEPQRRVRIFKGEG